MHPNGRFIYFKSNDDDVGKLEIDSNGNFLNSQNFSNAFWVGVMPISPSGNFIWTFHTSSVYQSSISIDPITGNLLSSTSNNNNLITITSGGPPYFYPSGNCIYSLDGNYQYCAHKHGVDSGVIKQMSVNSTTMFQLTPYNVTVETDSSNQGPKSIVLHPNGNYIFAYGVTNLKSYSINTGTGVINAAALSTVPAPGSCVASTSNTLLAIHTSGNYLYTVCNPTGLLASYPVSATGVISPHTSTISSGGSSDYRVIFVNGN